MEKDLLITAIGNEIRGDDGLPFYIVDRIKNKIKYAEIIKKAREKLNLKQEEFAKKINEKLSLVQNIERGKFKPSMNLAKKLERFLHVKLIESIEDSGISVEKSKSEGLTIGDFIKVKKS